jgi:hypothetical protein
MGQCTTKDDCVVAVVVFLGWSWPFWVDCCSSCSGVVLGVVVVLAMAVLATAVAVLVALVSPVDGLERARIFSSGNTA